MDKDGNKGFFTRLAENKHFEKMASNLVIPMAEMYFIWDAGIFGFGA